ncbi:MAG: ribosome silencing factor [bacterium]
MAGETRLTPKMLARSCGRLAVEKKAEDVVIIDLRKMSAPTDYFVICSGSSDKQIKAIVDHIIEQMETKGVYAWHVEGYTALRWVLLDYVDVVVHVFLEDARKFYSLETLWGDAPAERVKISRRSRKKV